MEKSLFETYLETGSSAVSQLAGKFKPSERDYEYYIKQSINDLKFAKQKIPAKHSIHGEQQEKKIDAMIEVLKEWISE